MSLRAALKSQPGVALSPAWDALSKAQSVRGQDRYADPPPPGLLIAVK